MKITTLILACLAVLSSPLRAQDADHDRGALPFLAAGASFVGFHAADSMYRRTDGRGLRAQNLRFASALFALAGVTSLVVSADADGVFIKNNVRF
jgi:hypothetical protein